MSAPPTGAGAGAVPDPAAAPVGDARVLVDLTGLPRPQRRRVVIAALEVMDPGVRLVVIDDHQPDALRALLRRRYGGLMGWAELGRSGDRVAVSIHLDEPADADPARSGASPPTPAGDAPLA